MPTYDYICTSCHKAWELEQRIVEDAVKKCPKCGKNTAKRQISTGAGFILKGGGWYADGYGSKKSSSTESKSDDKPAKADVKSDKSSEKTAEPTKTEDAKKTDAPAASGSRSGDGKKPKNAKASGSSGQ